MATQIKFEFEGVKYTLEYNRKTVSAMERNGFIADDVLTKPVTMLPALFAGAFMANHKWTKPETIEKIYAAMGDKEKLIGKLVEMYQEPVAALMDEPDGDTGNVTWTAV